VNVLDIKTFMFSVWRGKLLVNVMIKRRQYEHCGNVNQGCKS